MSDLCDALSLELVAVVEKVTCSICNGDVRCRENGCNGRAVATEGQGSSNYDRDTSAILYYPFDTRLLFVLLLCNQ